MLTNESLLAIRACCRDTGITLAALFRGGRLSSSLIHRWEKDPAMVSRGSVVNLIDGIDHMIAGLDRLRQHLRTRLEDTPCPPK